MANYFEKIDDFLLGKMTDTDRQDFEREMLNNSDLANSVSVYQLERRATQLEVRDNLRAEMAKWRSEKKTDETTETPIVATPVVALKPEKGKVVSMSRRIFQWAAAAAVLLVVVFVGRSIMSPSLSGLEITQKFYDEQNFGTRSATDTTLIASAEKAIEQRKDYKTALEILQQVQDTSLVARSLALKAHCHYKLGNFVAAAMDDQTVMNLKNIDPLSKQAAEWHWLLMKLAANQRDTAFESLLKQIEDDGQHQHQADALKLKKMLH